MPRGKKNTQPVQAASGQPYGERQASMEAQQQIPLPQGPPSLAGAGGPGPAGEPGPVNSPAGPPQGGDPMAALLEQAQGYAASQNVVPLNAPGSGGPLTAGLPVGPGPGPEAVPGFGLGQPQPPRAATVARQVAAATQDPNMSDMAARIEERAARRRARRRRR